MEDFNTIEQVRQRLIHSKDKITVTQLGATSRVNNELVRPVSTIAKKGITSTAINKLLYNLIHDFKCENIIELGTSFGINTMYMAANTRVKVYTFEGRFTAGMKFKLRFFYLALGGIITHGRTSFEGSFGARF